MFLSELKVQNFKSLENSDLKLGKLNLFIGKNNSGKSNLLNVLVFLKQSVNGFNFSNPFEFGSFDLIRHHKKGLERSSVLNITTKWIEYVKKNKLFKAVRKESIFILDVYLLPNLDHIIVFKVLGKTIGEIHHLDVKLTDQNNLKLSEPIFQNFGIPPPKNIPAINRFFHPKIPFSSSSQGSGLLNWTYKYKKPKSGKKDQDYWKTDLINDWKDELRKDFENICIIFEPRFIQRIKYNISQITPSISDIQAIGDKGEFISNILTIKKATSKKVIQSLLHWANEFGLKNIKTNILEEHQLELVINEKGLELPIAFMGAGSRKALSLIASSLVSNQNSILLVEEPENGLHPEYQALMMDFFIEQMEDKKQLIITTHSEHLLTRLQRRIAEKRIKTEDIGIFWVSRENSSTKIEPVEIDQQGIFPKGLKTYLDFTKKELRAINKAREK